MFKGESLANDVAMQTFARGHDLHDLMALAYMHRDAAELRPQIEQAFHAYKSRILLGTLVTVKQVRIEFNLI